MKHYKITISYKGSHYFGWQIQKGQNSVQAELNRALQSVFKSSEVKSLASGRTDTGVHALAQVVQIEVPFEIEKEGLIKALNSHLPADIRVNEARDSDARFMPTIDAKKKEYFYLFSNQSTQNAFQGDHIPNISYDLDFDLMHKACTLFLGEHDFSDFQCVGSDVKTSVRTIYRCEIQKFPSSLFGIYPEHYALIIEGSGFLKQMVRLIMGTIWNVGRGKTTLLELESSLRKPLGYRLGPVAMPNGLHMHQVEYK